MDVSRRRYIVHLFIIQLFGCLGWLCNVALALTELSDSVTGSINFPDIEIAFIGNLAIFITSLLRGRLDLEMGVRDVLATLRGPKLFRINKDFGLTTCKDQEKRFKDASVVMLSYNTPNSSMRQFMKYICNAYKVHSILLQCFPLKIKYAKHPSEEKKSSPLDRIKSLKLRSEEKKSSTHPSEEKKYSLLDGICNCKHIKCDCIVFWNVEDVIMMLAHRMPRRLIRLSDSLCLLPCPHCHDTGCHGSKQGQYVEETDESGRKVSTERDYISGGDIVRGIFDYISENAMEQEHSCICIPLSPSGYDYWTKLLTRSFRATGQANRAYSTASLLLPRLTEVSLNLLLTAWFRVDGFSSSLVARRAIKDYVVDEKGSGFAANAFLTKTRAKENNQCQVLEFRRTILGIKTFSYAVACVNLICSISWAVLVACQGSFGKWYDWHSIPPSKWRVGVIMIAIGIALGMDFLHLYLYSHSPSNFENQPTVSKQSAEPNVNTDSKESTKPTEPTAKVDSKEPTAPTDEGNSEKPAEATQEAVVDSTNPTELTGKVDSIQPPETTGKADSMQPTVKVWIPPIVKRWFRPVVTVLKMVWSPLEVCFRPVVTVLKKVWSLLEVWFRPAVRVLKMVWSHLKKWFRPVLTVLKKVWSCLVGWFRPVVTVLKKRWSRLEILFRPVVTVLKEVWPRLEVWFRPVVTVLKKVWSSVEVLFSPAVRVLKMVWSRLKRWWSRLKAWFRPKAWFLYLLNPRPMVWAVIVLEILCIAGLGTLGIKFVGRWVYSALQVLVWIKWITGSYLLGEYPPEYDTQYDYDNGVIVYSSAFLLNSILAGVRGNWSYSLSLES